MPAVLSSRLTFSVTDSTKNDPNLYNIKQGEVLQHYSDEYYALLCECLYRVTLNKEKAQMRIEFIELGKYVGELQFDSEDIRDVIDWEELENNNTQAEHERARSVIASNLLDILILKR